MEDKDLAWAAGFLEGEGSFTYSGKSYCLRITAQQKDRWPLERLQEILGGSIYPHGTRDIWSYYLGGSLAIEAFAKLKPMLSPRRQEQIEKALALRETIPRAGSEGHRKRLSEAAYARHEGCCG